MVVNGLRRSGGELQDLVDDADYAASQSITSSTGFPLLVSKSGRSEIDSTDDKEVIFIKDNVAVHPTQNAQQRINGKLRIMKEGTSVFMAWIPYAQRNNQGVPDSAMNDRHLYTIQDMPLSKIRSIRRHNPPLGWQYIIIVLTSGLAFPPLYFHNGGIKEFLFTLKEHVHIVRSAENANLFLVNDIIQDPLQRSLTSLQLRDVVSKAALPSEERSNLQEAIIGPQSTLLANVNKEGNCFVQDNGSSLYIASDSARQQQRRIRDPARDISIQVLEKFSLVTKFARDTTAQLFGESRLLGNNDGLEDLNNSFSKMENRNVLKREHSEQHDVTLSESRPMPSIDASDIRKASVANQSPPLNMEEWLSYFDDEGRIMKSKELRKRIFYGGIQHDLRSKVWKFLLGFYSYDSTNREREQLLAEKREEYTILKTQWQTISDKQAKRFTKFRERKSRIEKDVVRTDRSIPFYAGDDNRNVTVLRDILITYSFYNFDLGYCQGMSDFLSPILYILEDEADAFWCFSSLMEHMGPNFHRDQNGMHSQLLAVSKLVQLLDYPLHAYLKQADCLNFFFCFRWLLIQFKREFNYEDVIRLWERLWTNHLTEHLHLYICVALLQTYKKKIVEEEMDFDSLLKFINELSGRIDLDAALRDAEALFKTAGDLGADCIPPGTPPALQVSENESVLY